MAKHQWLIFATYEFSEEELTRMEESKQSVGLNFERLVDVSAPGCFKCERTWHEGKGTSCAVPDEDRLVKDPKLRLVRTGRVEEYDRD